MYVLKHVNAPDRFPVHVIEQCYSEGEVVVSNGVCVVREEGSKDYLHGVGYDCIGEIDSLDQLSAFLEGSSKTTIADAKQASIGDIVVGSVKVESPDSEHSGIDLAVGNSELDYWWKK